MQVAVPMTILRLADVTKVVGLSKPHIYRMIKAGEFPQQIKLGKSAVGWSSIEVTQWIQDRMASRTAAA
jgi:prophage regulatory protein